jgi:hypothetical protein
MDKMYKVKHHEFGYYLVPLHVNWYYLYALLE